MLIGAMQVLCFWAFVFGLGVVFVLLLLETAPVFIVLADDKIYHNGHYCQNDCDDDGIGLHICDGGFSPLS